MRSRPVHLFEGRATCDRLDGSSYLSPRYWQATPLALIRESFASHLLWSSRKRSSSKGRPLSIRDNLLLTQHVLLNFNLILMAHFAPFLFVLLRGGRELLAGEPGSVGQVRSGRRDAIGWLFKTVLVTQLRIASSSTISREPTGSGWQTKGVLLQKPSENGKRETTKNTDEKRCSLLALP